MEPQQGVPEMARRMMPVLRDMVSAYKVGCWWSVGREGVRSCRTLALLVWKSSLWHFFFAAFGGFSSRFVLYGLAHYCFQLQSAIFVNTSMSHF